MFLLNTVGLNETDEGLAAVSAAKAAKVKKIVYMSVSMPKGSEKIPHFRSKLPVEKAIKESKIAYTILRPNNFFQNDLGLKSAIMQYSVYPQPMGTKGLNRVDVRDIADCAVNALMRSGHEGQTYEVNGPDTLTGEGIARIYTKHLGQGGPLQRRRYRCLGGKGKEHHAGVPDRRYAHHVPVLPGERDDRFEGRPRKNAEAPRAQAPDL